VGGAAAENADAWRLRAWALADLERHREALEAARSGLRIEPDDTYLLALGSRAAAELGDLPEAERLVLAALRIDPDDAELLAQYALLLVRGGQAKKAAAVLARAERIDPENGTVVRAQAMLAFLAGDDRDARRHGERILADVPDDPVGHAILGATASVRGAAGKASRHLDETARYDVRDNATAAAAREARIEAHWLLWPMRPVNRFGPAVLWIVGIGGALVLDTIGLGPLGLIWIGTYVLLAIYSWTVAPLARRFLRRRIQ
jgi:tetratricopeptide (TPR) repeat protein